MNKAQRIETFDSGSTHAMTLTAVDLNAEGKPLKWKVENSWGPSYGQNGYLIMTDNWFQNYMFRLVVNKRYVPETLLKQFDADDGHAGRPAVPGGRIKTLYSPP